MEHWKLLVCEKNAKANINSVELKVCKAEEVRKYFVNLKIENEVSG